MFEGIEINLVGEAEISDMAMTGALLEIHSECKKIAECGMAYPHMLERLEKCLAVYHEIARVNDEVRHRNN